MPKSTRSKGLGFTHEVKRILEGMQHNVDGPFYKSAFFNGKINAVHFDIFGCFDLISYDGLQFIGHQVSTEANKSAKIKAIQEANLPGWVWTRYSEDGTVGYKVYEIMGETITEHEMTYGIRRKIKAI